MLKLPDRKPRRKFGDPLPEHHLERDVREQIRGAINRLPWARVWLNQEHVYETNGRKVYLPGLCKGSADLVGIVMDPEASRGVFLAIETKTRKHRTNVSEEQESWLATVQRLGGVAGTAYTLRQALELVAEARGCATSEVIAELDAIVGRTVDLGDSR